MLMTNQTENFCYYLAFQSYNVIPHAQHHQHTHLPSKTDGIFLIFLSFGNEGCSPFQSQKL